MQSSSRTEVTGVLGSGFSRQRGWMVGSYWQMALKVPAGWLEARLPSLQLHL